MGGENQTVSKADPVKPPVENNPDIIDLRGPEAAQKDKKRKTDKSKKKPKQPKPPKKQTQNIRQHVSGGECHFHDDANGLKGAVPVSEMVHARRELRRMNQYQWVDSANQTIITFTPQIVDGEVDVVKQVERIGVSQRYVELYELTGK
jgi:hypothetical protein